MIDYEKSAELNQCTVEELKARFERSPSSHKKVVAVCDGCGDTRPLKFYKYRALCHKCAVTTPEYTEHKLKMLEKHWENQDVRDEMSKIKKKFYDDHPSARAAASKKTTEQYSTPIARAAQSRRLKKYYANNPNAIVVMSKRMIQYHIDNPEAREEDSTRRRQQFIDDPTAMHLLTETRMKAYMEHPEMFDAANENMRGGHDIVSHHYLYDDTHPSRYTMPMTRSEHATMHARMRVNNYEVPHINSAEDSDTSWGYNMGIQQ